MRPSETTNFLANIEDLYQRNINFGIVTVLAGSRGTMRLLVTEDDTKTDVIPRIDQELSDELVQMARQAILRGSRTVLAEIAIHGETCAVIVEVMRPKPSVIVFGAGHVGHAVAIMANIVGYSVTVVDDREAFANRERLPDPGIAIRAEPFESAARSITITTNTAVVIVTRGHQYDELCLRLVIQSRARYIGMIGSRRRVISVFKQLTESGVEPGLLHRVHAPIGLAISARSPQEIAVAILAEIIQTFNSHAEDS